MNREIRAPEVRLIGVKGEPIGVVKLDVALNMAADQGVDLVEVAPHASPPVCKIMDFGKFKYQESKKAHEAKLKQKVVQLKEVKFRPNTGEGDYQIKLRNCHSFLDEGHKVKTSLRFRGREMAHQEIGLQVLDRVKNDLESVAIPEQLPKMEGRQIVMVLAGKKKKL